MQIREAVRHFVVENFTFGRQTELTDEDSFQENGIIDSTGVLELIGFIEEHFALKLQDSDLIPENLDSIQRVTDFVQRRLGVNNGAA
jgi:acyl carrier protein